MLSDWPVRLLVPGLFLLSSAMALGAGTGAEPSAKKPRCLGAAATIVGTGGADRLAGTRRADVIVAKGGNDVIRARGGNDKVCDGGGRDRIDGGAGKDRLGGGSGSDTVAGGAGNDRVGGGAGNDKLRGNGGADRLTGGPGIDDCLGGPGADTILSCETGDVPLPEPGDQPPVAVADAGSVTEDASAQPLDVLANDSDPDAGPKSIGSATQPPNGTVEVTGGGSGLSYQPDANYCNSPGAGPTDDFTYALAPGGSTAGVAISVQCVNDKPSLTTSAAPRIYSQGSGARTIDPGLTAGDVDSSNLSGATVRISGNFAAAEDALAFTDKLGITGTYDSGTGVLTLTGGASVADYQAALRSVTYETSAAPPSPDRTVTFQISDADSLASDPATRDLAIGGPNDPPLVDTTTPALDYMENDPATPVDAAVAVTDAQSHSITGASVSITTNFQAGEDGLGWVDNDAGDNVTLGGSSNAQTIVLTGTDTAASYQAALRAVTYVNSSETPSSATRTVTFSATDELDDTGTGTRDIDVTPVDDPPVAVDDNATVAEDAAATAIDVLANDTDVDAGPKMIASATDPANGTVVLTGGSPGEHTGLTYQPDPDYCNDSPMVPADTFTYTLNGGDSATVSMTVTCVNDAAVADDETFTGAHGNTTMVVDDPDDEGPSPSNPHKVVTGDILAGDTDVDGPGPLTVTPGTFATNDGGQVTIEADGDFTFEPAASTSCTDTSDFFDYTVEDSGSPELTDTGRVTIAIAGCVWYVHNNGTGNSGTSAQPFDTLAQAETASGAQHTVFVFDGDNTTTGYDTGFTMNSGERLIGEHEGLAVSGDSLHPANPGARPTLTASGEDVVSLDDGNEVRGFVLDPQGAGGGIAGGAGDTGGGTFVDVSVVDGGTAGTQPGVELDGTSGTFNFSNLAVTTNGAQGIRLNFAGTADFETTTITTTGAKALHAASTSMGTSTFDAITATGSGDGGVELANTTGTTTFGNGVGPELALTTISGATPAFRLSTAGTVSVPEAGSAVVAATGGPAIDITGTTPGTGGFSFDDADSTNSSGDGINLGGLGAGAFSAGAGSTIAGAAGIAFDLDGGSGAITFPGTLGNGTGQAVRVTGRSGGPVDFSGPVTDTNDVGGGFSLNGNTGGSTTFSNATKTLNTGSASAVAMTSSDGHTLNLTGGGLDIDTTTGNGLEATSSGAITVTGSGNTVDTGSGRGLHVSDTDIGDGDLTFQRISSNGSINGIRLNNTANPNGRLFLTGTGSGTCQSGNTSGCTGGTIANSTQSGVVLNSVPGGAELTRVAVTDSSDHGITAATVAGGIRLHTSAVLNSGNASAENGLDYANVHGITTIQSSDIVGSRAHNALISNTSGTLHLTVNDNDFNNTDPALTGQGEDGLQLLGVGTATMRSNITGNRFDDNKGDAFQVGSAGAGPASVHDVTFTGNTIDGRAGTATDGGIVFGPDGSVRGAISNNTITNTSVSALILNPNPVSTAGASFDAAASNNTIGNNSADSGSVDGDGIQLKSASDGASRIAITNNTIRNFNQKGIWLRASESNGSTTHVTATGNAISQPDATFSEAGLWLQAGSSSGDALTMCADVGGAGALANTFTGPLSAGGGIADFVLDLRFAGSVLRLPGYSGTTVTDRQNYFLGRNTGFGTFAQDGLQNPVNHGGPCTQPASPTLPTAP